MTRVNPVENQEAGVVHKPPIDSPVDGCGFT